MFSDTLSNIAAGVMGGLGLAPSINVGSQIAYFNPFMEVYHVLLGRIKPIHLLCFIPLLYS